MSVHTKLPSFSELTATFENDSPPIHIDHSSDTLISSHHSTVLIRKSDSENTPTEGGQNGIIDHTRKKASSSNSGNADIPLNYQFPSSIHPQPRSLTLPGHSLDYSIPSTDGFIPTEERAFSYKRNHSTSSSVDQDRLKSQTRIKNRSSSLDALAEVSSKMYWLDDTFRHNRDDMKTKLLHGLENALACFEEKEGLWAAVGKIINDNFEDDRCPSEVLYNYDRSTKPVSVSGKRNGAFQPSTDLIFKRQSLDLLLESIPLELLEVNIQNSRMIIDILDDWKQYKQDIENDKLQSWRNGGSQIHQVDEDFDTEGFQVHVGDMAQPEDEHPVKFSALSGPTSKVIPRPTNAHSSCLTPKTWILNDENWNQAKTEKIHKWRNDTARQKPKSDETIRGLSNQSAETISLLVNPVFFSTQKSSGSTRAPTLKKPPMLALPPTASAKSGYNDELSRKNREKVQCLQCGSTETPEWRRGPYGSRTLCNACGLFHSKLVKRKGEAEAAKIMRGRLQSGQGMDRRILIL
ncbi:hypothetical protein BABINDRAFT_177391 [Babjeviella inositovora NRRL Y-12698]|uniref:GATA-type domain-containing protein n=1 Tax=Babjeviella inositovora NRRL Y-12698 TaxID=984486 RepID=A0A1E3QKG9_9ASCO|nr:uncharacterized protein BABINDRAFT_177391 [Babjeviella inositovora NRRL Y-12698]ODQ78183.1 hypothetical protein BABINDRAFT_177391 [Babjeviella inositovora NRRL Y-12698]